MLMCTLCEGGSEKVYVLYTHLSVDNYGWPLKIYLFEILCGDVQWFIYENSEIFHGVLPLTIGF